jgi:hypothetical protein
MLAKKTSKNQVTLPAALVRQLPDVEYFDASVVAGAVVLRPVRMVPAVDLADVRRRIQRAGVKPTAVRRAVRWSRGH